MPLPESVPTADVHAYYPGETTAERTLAGVTLVTYRFAHADAPVTVPANADSHALSLGVCGQAVVTREAYGRTTRQLVRPGTVGLDPAFQPQTWTWDAPHDVFTAYVADDALRDLAETAGLDPGCVRLRPRQADDPALRSLLESLHAVTTDGGPDRRLDALYADGAAHLLGLHLLRRYAEAPADEPAAGRLAGPALRRVLDAVEARLAEPLRLADLAREAALSPYHFARAFRAAVGVSPYQYVLQRRVERARELLASGEYRAGEAGAALGFSDPSHFTRAFKRHTGRTPSAFLRESLR